MAVMHEIESEDRLWKRKERKRQRSAAVKAEREVAEREAERERLFREVEQAKEPAE